ncbi:MAG: hypothetical protein DMG35_16955 [Acidobacteria bacterium]|nr:MAG: hypothetical protein AUH86_07770 [Acidobacteria bacterium 13_1_40CM_4_58_4]PYT58669.1 MAG: hypothetical protein DMG35_16955 [Acidobacteriota bacterium]
MFRRAILSFLLFAAISIDGRVARPTNETLRQALAAKHLPTDAGKLANFDKSITSWAELDDANQYVISYYVDDGTNELNPPLFLDRYDRKQAEWKSASFPDAHTNSAQPDGNCYGSILRVAALGSRLFLDTHINPSAGCLLVLSPDLKLEASLYGWLLGQLGTDLLVYHRSQIHFAPVHPAEIALYDLRTRRDVTFFPTKPDSAIRRARTAQLAEFYKVNKGWCNKNDDPCDPENFDYALQGEVATNEAEGAIAFLISYEQIQLVQGDVQKPSGPKDVLYVYRWVDDEAKMEYREMLLEDAKARFGTSKLPDLVQAEILQKIFAEAAAK